MMPQEIASRFEGENVGEVIGNFNGSVSTAKGILPLVVKELSDPKYFLMTFGDLKNSNWTVYNFAIGVVYEATRN